jgi:hypothetical protein
MKLVSQAVHKIVKFLSRRLSVIIYNILPSTIVCTMIIGTGMYKIYEAGLPISLTGRLNTLLLALVGPVTGSPLRVVESRAGNQLA